MHIFLGFLVLSPLSLLFIFLIFFNFLKLFRSPKRDRDWDALQKNLASIEHKEKTDEIFVRNIRNARYNPVFEFENKIEYQSKRYHLKDLTRLWILATTNTFFKNEVVLSFQFGDRLSEASFITISYEVRKTDPLVFTHLQIFYKYFESCYFVATEEDSFFVRTNVRKYSQDNSQKYFMYAFDLEKEKLQKVFLKFIDRVNLYNQKAFEYRFYSRNTLTETLGVLRKEKLFDFSFLDYFFLRRLFKKNAGIEYKITNENMLRQNSGFSLELRSGLEKTY